MLMMVTSKPLTFTIDNSSWNTIPAALIVTTSLKMPQMLSVTTLVRWSNVNSLAIMQKARHPGTKRRRKDLKAP